jgi:hypothetical protein
MPVSPPDSPDAPTICARCGSQLGDGMRVGSCRTCMAGDLAAVEWNDLLTPGGPELLAGGGFTLVEEIARGGMGIVYRAQQHSPAREVALKLLPPSFAPEGDGAQRLLAEAAMLAELDHPGILPLYASGVQDGRPWLAMKLASGGTLGTRQPQWQGRWRECAELAAGLADAVQHAHERGLIHRDLKPGNILFDEAGRAHVADFGLAKWRDRESNFTQSHSVLGTPAFMPPEVAEADARAATTASDVYGLGAVLYFILTGHAPYEKGSTMEVLRRIVTSDPVPPRQKVKDIPADLEVICLKALARQPSARYSGPDALAADLRRWLAGESIEARPASSVEKVCRWVRRHPLSAGLAAALMLTLAGGGAALWKQNADLIVALRDRDFSLHTAYESMGYATREIPAQLEAAGRLAELDGLLTSIERKFQDLANKLHRQDSAGLVYQAELYAHWSRVLGWQDRMEDRRRRNLEAVHLADQAVEVPGAEARAFAVQGMAHRLLCELLTDEQDFDACFEELKKASAAVQKGLEAFENDLLLRREEAEIAHQRCASLGSAGDYDGQRRAAPEVRRLWSALEPDATAPHAEPDFRLQFTEQISLDHEFLAQAAESLGETGGAVNHARNLLKERNSQFKAAPASTMARYRAAITMLRLARALDNHKATLLLLPAGQRPALPPDFETSVVAEITQLLDSADKLLAELVAMDGGNQMWHREYASSALHRRYICTDAMSLEQQEKCASDCIERLKPVKENRLGSRILKLLVVDHRLNVLAERAEGAARWQGLVEEGRGIVAASPPAWALFDYYADVLDKAGRAVPASHREAAAQEWIESARAEAAMPGASPWWKGVEAAAQNILARNLASGDGRGEETPEAMLARLEKARDAGRSALALRVGLLESGGTQCRTDMISDVEKSCQTLLAIEPASPADARLVLQTLIDAAPHALKSGLRSGWRNGWSERGLIAAKNLPDEAEGKHLRAELYSALYGAGTPVDETGARMAMNLKEGRSP